MDQGLPCPCSLAPWGPGLAHTHHASCLNTDSHASPWSQHLLNTALGTVTPAVPQQQPQCALHMPETQDSWPWKCAFLQSPSPVSGPRARLARGTVDRGARTQAFHQCRGREQKERMDLSSRSPSLHLESRPVQWLPGYHWCSLCLPACLLGEALGCGLQPGTTAAGTTVTVPLNLHFADPTFLPVCHYPVFCTCPAAMVGPKEMRTGHRNHGHSLSP